MNNRERTIIHRFFNTQRTSTAQFERPFVDRCATKKVYPSYYACEVSTKSKSNVLYIYDTPVAAVFPGRITGTNKEPAKDVVVVSSFIGSRTNKCSSYFCGTRMSADCWEMLKSIPHQDYEIVTVLGPLPEPDYKHSPYNKELPQAERRQDLITYLGKIMQAHADNVLTFVMNNVKAKRRLNNHTTSMSTKENAWYATKCMQAFDDAKAAFGCQPKKLCNCIEKYRSKCASVVATAMAQLRKDNPKLFTTSMQYVASTFEEYDARVQMEYDLTQCPMFGSILPPTKDQFDRTRCETDRDAMLVRLRHNIMDDSRENGALTHAEYLTKLAVPIVNKYMGTSLLKVKRYTMAQLIDNIFPIDLYNPAESVVACICLCQPHKIYGSTLNLRYLSDGTDTAQVVIAKKTDADGNEIYYADKVVTGRGASIAGAQALRAAAVIGKLFLTDPSKIDKSIHVGCYTVHPSNKGDEFLRIGCHRFNKDTVSSIVSVLSMSEDAMKDLRSQQDLALQYKSQARQIEPSEVKELEGYQEALKEVREKLAEVENGPNSYKNLRREYKRKCFNNIKKRIQVIMDYDDAHQTAHTEDVMLTLQYVNDAIKELECTQE